MRRDKALKVVAADEKLFASGRRQTDELGRNRFFLFRPSGNVDCEKKATWQVGRATPLVADLEIIHYGNSAYVMR